MNDYQKSETKRISPQYGNTTLIHLDADCKILFATERVSDFSLDGSVLNETAPNLGDICPALKAEILLITTEKVRKVIKAEIGGIKASVIVYKMLKIRENVHFHCYLIAENSEDYLERFADACQLEIGIYSKSYLDDIGAPVVITENGKMTFCNRVFTQMTGYDITMLHGMRFSKLASRDSKSIIEDIENGEMPKGASFVSLSTQKGGFFNVKLYASSFGNQSNMVLHVLEDRKQEMRDQFLLKLFVGTSSAVDEAIAITDKDYSPFWVNPCFEKQLGYSRDNIQPLIDHIKQYHNEISAQLISSDYWYKLEHLTTADGGDFYAEIYVTRLVQDHFCVRIKDASEKIKAVQLLKSFKTTDYLTGVNNAVSFGNELRREFSDAKEKGRRLSVIMFSVNNYNDLFFGINSQTADALLKMTAQRAKGFLDDTNGLARLGENRFGAYFTTDTEEQALRMMEQFMSFMDVSMIYEGTSYFAKAYAGMCSYPDNTGDIAGLYSGSRSALTEASKSQRPAFAYQTKDGIKVTEHKSSFEYEIEKSVNGNDFYMVYQPVVGVAENLPVALEALLRTKSPLISDGVSVSFLQAAEATGAIIPISYKMLSKVAEYQSGRVSDEKQFLPIFFNLAYCHLLDENLTDFCEEVFRYNSIPKNSIIFQISADDVSLHPKNALEAVKNLSECGFKVNISHFSQKTDIDKILAVPDIGILALGRSVAAELENDNSELFNYLKQTVENIHFADGKLSIVGIETQKQLDIIKELGFDYYQGFIFAKPEKTDNLPSILGDY